MSTLVVNQITNMDDEDCIVLGNNFVTFAKPILSVTNGTPSDYIVFNVQLEPSGNAALPNRLLRHGEMDCDLFSSARVTSNVSSIVVNLPPAPYSVEVQYINIRVHPNESTVSGRFFGCDFSFDNGTTWIIHGWTREQLYYPINSTSSALLTSAWNTNGIAWALSYNSTNHGGNNIISGSLFLTRFGTGNTEPNIGHGFSFYTFRHFGSIRPAFSEFVVGPSTTPHPNQPPITNLRFRWNWNPNIVSGVVRVISRRL